MDHKVSDKNLRAKIVMFFTLKKIFGLDWLGWLSKYIAGKSKWPRRI